MFIKAYGFRSIVMGRDRISIYYYISIYTLWFQEISSLTFHTFRKEIPIALIGRVEPGYGNEYSNNDSYNERYDYGNYKRQLRQRWQQRMDNGQQMDSVVRFIKTIEKRGFVSSRFLSCLAGITKQSLHQKRMVLIIPMSCSRRKGSNYH